jgi:hypothetical protein
LGALLPLKPSSDEDGPAVFRYYPRDVGTERLTFDALPVSSPFATASPPILAHPRPFEFEVTNCNLKVQQTDSLLWPGEFGDVIYGTGVIEEVTVEADEDGQLHGEGTYVYNQIITGIPLCSITWATIDFPVTITGQMGGEQLELDFAFGDGTSTGRVDCPTLSTEVTVGGNPSGAFASRVIFPSDGGVMVYPSPATPPGATHTIFLIVTVEEDEEAISDAGAPILAALGGWSRGWFAGWLGQTE